MNYFLAVNDRQLGTCLRMLFAEKLQPAVQTVLNEKGKIEFHISIAAGSVRRAERTLQDHDFVSYSISKVKGP